MVDPKLFDAMKPEQAVRAVVALVVWHGLVSRPDYTASAAVSHAFLIADMFLERALKP